MAWLAALALSDTIAVTATIVAVCGVFMAVLLMLVQRHRPVPRVLRPGVAAAANVGIALTLVVVIAGVGVLGVRVATIATTTTQASSPSDPLAASTPAATADATTQAETPSFAQPSDENALVDLPAEDSNSRLVQVTEATLPDGAVQGDEPWPTMDGLCSQLGRGPHAWLPGQTVAWDWTRAGEVVLANRQILAPGAAFTWSCSLGGEFLAQAELDYSCATYYGATYAAAVVNPDNAYSWVCRQRT